MRHCRDCRARLLPEIEAMLADEFGGEAAHALADVEDQQKDELFETNVPFDDLLVDETPTRRRGTADISTAIERQRRRIHGFERAVRSLAPYVRRQGDSFQLDISSAAIPRVAQQLRIQPQGVAMLVQSAARARIAPVLREIAYESGAGCKGVTRYSLEWWGHRLALNSCHTNHVLDAAEAGAGAATICAAIPALKNQVVCGVVAGLLTLGRLVVRRIHDRGGRRGIVIRKPHIGPVVVWHQ
jgi:hypothetical protein